MISSALALALLIAAAQADPGPARKAYSGCLHTYLKTSLEQKMAPEAFDAAVQPACANQEAAFRGAVVAFEKAYGLSQGEAEDVAASDVSHFLSEIKDLYRAHVEGGEPPAQ